MRNFNEYKNSVIETQIKGGKKIFDIQLKSAEGRNIEIDGVLTRGIILNHLNDMSTTKDQRGLNVSLETPIKKGNFVRDLYEDKIYLVLSNIDNHYAYKTCTMEFCNQTINFNGLKEGMKVVAEGESYGVKIFQGNNDFLTTVDTKVKVTIGDNEITRKYLKPNARIMFKNSQYGIYKIGDIIVYNDGLLTAVCKKDSYMVGLDDLENNICWQPNDESDNHTKYSIIGSDEIPIGDIRRYELIPNNKNANIVIDNYIIDNGIVKVDIVDNSTINIEAIKPNELIEFSFNVEGEIVSKNVITVR